jgi:hypothetical protein
VHARPTHAQPAQVGNPFVGVFPASGTQNTTYTVTGSGFNRFDQITIIFTDPNGNDFPFRATLLGGGTDANGSFKAAVRPGDFLIRGVSGLWFIQACDSCGSCNGNDVAITLVGSSGAGAPRPPAGVPIDPGSLPPASRPAPPPARPATSARAGAGSISITPSGRQNDTFTILGINWAPFDQFAISFVDPLFNTFDYVADNGSSVVTADNSGR